MPRWRSARELLAKVSSIAPDELQQSPEKLDDVLQEILETWPRLSLKILTSVFLSKFEMSLAAAVQKLEKIGFGSYVKGLRTEAVAAVAFTAIKNRRGFSMRWCLEDFELVLEEWGGLDDDAQKWLAKQFLYFWQSRSGEEELRAGGQYGATISRFKAIWSHAGRATMSIKLEPAKAIGLGWDDREVEALLSDFVDVNGDCATLAEDLQNSNLLKPKLVSTHEGLFSACIDVCPEFLVSNMLLGQISFPDQKPQPSLVLRLVKAAAKVIDGWGSAGVAQLTDQQARHLTTLLMDVVGFCADKSIAMFQAQEYIVDLALSLEKRQGLAPMLRYVSGFYIGQTKPWDWGGFFLYTPAVAGEGASRRAMVPVSKQDGSAPALVLREREVDSFSSLLAYLLAHKRALDIETLVNMQTCSDKMVNAALRRQLHQWTLRELSGAVLDVREGGGDDGARRCYKASTLKTWLQTWVRPVCDGAQTCEVFEAMAAGLDSWQFVLDVAESLGRVAYAERPPAEQALVTSVYQFAHNKLAACEEQISTETPARATRSPRDAILQMLLRLHPQQFAQDFEVRAYLRTRKGVESEPAAYLGKVHAILFSPIMSEERRLFSSSSSGFWQYALDTFDPVETFKRSFILAPEFAKIEKSKTKEQWDMVVRVVGFVTPELLTDLDIARRLSTLLCAVWSNHLAWQSLCADFVVKLFKAATLWRERSAGSGQVDGQTPPPGELLVTFTVQCPHEQFLAVPKKQWVISLLGAAVKKLKSPDDKTLSLLFATHGSSSAEDLADLIQASTVEDICKETEDLLFSQLLPVCRVPDAAKSASSGPKDKVEPRPLVEQVRLLLKSKFKARSSLRAEGRKTECVDCGGAEFWEELERGAGEASAGDVQGYAVLSEFEGALETEAVVRAETENRRMDGTVIEDSVYRRFGESGERVVLAFLQAATAKDLLDLFREFGGKLASSFFCGGPEDLLLKHWQPMECVAEEAATMVDLLTEHTPQLWSRCGQLVWGQERLEVTEAHSKLLQRLLRKRVPELELLPQRWWHAVDVATLAHHCVTTLKDQDPLQRLAQAGVPIELQAVKKFFEDASFTVTTQALLLDLYAASDAFVLAEFLPLFAGPVLGYLERLFWLLDKDPATRQRLVQTGDGVEEEEKYASGWNKVANTLLTGLRVRCRDDRNWLHSDEQLALFAYCCEKTRVTSGFAAEEPQEEAAGQPKFPKWLLNQGNGAVLGDLLEAKCVDPRHSARAVNLVLSAARPQMVRDAALRAMLRLSTAERHALIHKLLASPHKLPLGVLFALTVTHLSEDAVPSVVRRLKELDDEEIDALVDLIRDANPAASNHIHTFPRRAGVQEALFERFLVRYVAGDPVGVVQTDRWTTATGKGAKPPPAKRSRDQRFFCLFLACCRPERVPSYLLDLLDRQLLDVNDVRQRALLLSGFEPLPHKLPHADSDAVEPGGQGDADSQPRRHCDLKDFEILLEHMGYSDLLSHLPWIWQQVLAWNQDADGQGLALLRAVLRHAVGGGAAVASKVIESSIDWGQPDPNTPLAAGGQPKDHGGAILRCVSGASDLLYAELLAVSPSLVAAKPAKAVQTEEQALWVKLLARTWALEQRAEGTELDSEVLEARAKQLAEVLPVLLAERLRGTDLRPQRPSKTWWDAPAHVLPAAAVRALGVDLEARVLLVQVVPTLALQTWGREILRARPAFAVELHDADFEPLCSVTSSPRGPLAATLTDVDWPMIRSVLAALLADQTHQSCSRALNVAIKLLHVTKQEVDLGLVKAAYLGISARERRQTRLMSLLKSLWPKFGGLLQGVVDAAAQQDGLRTAARGCVLGEVLERMDLVES